MKPLRLVGAIAGVLAAGLLALVALAFNSSFQTWAAKRWLAAHPQVRVSLGHVAAGLNQVELTGVRVESAGGAVLELPRVTADLSVLKALFKKAEVRHLSARGWTLDLTHARHLAATLQGLATTLRATESDVGREFSLLPSARAADPAPAPMMFHGILTQIVLPLDVAVDALELEGEAVLPPLAGYGGARVNVTLRGGGLGVGRTGTFVLDLASAKGDGSSLTLHTVLTTGMATPRTFSRLGTKSDVTVSDTQFPEGVKLSIDAAAERSAPGESYTIALATGAKQLLALRADYNFGTSRLAGTWKVDAQRLDFEPFALGHPLPEFTAMGAGSFETGGTFAELHASGRLTASVAHLENALPELASMLRP